MKIAHHVKHHDGFAMWDTATTDYNFASSLPPTIV